MIFFRFLGAAAVGIVLSCSSGPRATDPRARMSFRYCSAHLQNLESKLSGAVAALNPWLLQRALASGETTFEAMEMAPQDQKSWAEWAGSQIAELHDRLDELPHRGPSQEIRRELSDAVTSLVTFTGYSLNGRADRMVKTLEVARQQTWRARERACNIE